MLSGYNIVSWDFDSITSLSFFTSYFLIQKKDSDIDLVCQTPLITHKTYAIYINKRTQIVENLYIKLYCFMCRLYLIDNTFRKTFAVFVSLYAIERFETTNRFTNDSIDSELRKASFVPSWFVLTIRGPSPFIKSSSLKNVNLFILINQPCPFNSRFC